MLPIANENKRYRRLSNIFTIKIYLSVKKSLKSAKQLKPEWYVQYKVLWFTMGSLRKKLGSKHPLISNVAQPQHLGRFS